MNGRGCSLRSWGARLRLGFLKHGFRGFGARIRHRLAAPVRGLCQWSAQRSVAKLVRPRVVRGRIEVVEDGISEWAGMLASLVGHLPAARFFETRIWRIWHGLAGPARLLSPGCTPGGSFRLSSPAARFLNHGFRGFGARIRHRLAGRTYLLHRLRIPCGHSITLSVTRCVTFRLRRSPAVRTPLRTVSPPSSAMPPCPPQRPPW